MADAAEESPLAMASASLSSGLRSFQPVLRLEDHLETPALDDCAYRLIRLSNELEVLLVHDADTDKASAAMDVNVGSFSDQDDMPGMAHAVEHLLFMGTEKYPKENAYREYLVAHSGYSNAYTASTSTNYYFELAATDKPEHGSADAASSGSSAGQGVDRSTSPLYGALDRFAQFFIAPLFLDSTLDRELQAVHSEHKKNLQNDMWRLYQLSKSTANPKHPFCHFSTGNLETLQDGPRARGLDVRREFIRFHEEQYSANRMKLVVLGRESLDDLEAWVAELFAGIRNKNLPKIRWDTEQPLTKNELLTQCFAKPVMDSHTLQLTFPFLDEEYLFDSQPGRYLSHLIGHEGPGSILAYVKRRGWATELSAGSMQICPGSSMFDISISLTVEGLKYYKEIIHVVFEYISLMRASAPQEWIFDEMKVMAEVNFRFKQKTPASDFASATSAMMQQPIPRNRLLSGRKLLREFDSRVISEALEYLRSDNFRLTLISNQLSEDLHERERWYGTEYKLEKIPASDLAEIVKAERKSSSERLPDLHLPHKNHFIPTQLEVEKKDVKEPAKTPKLIRNEEGVRTWWKKDDRFWVPKAKIFIMLRTPLVNVTPANRVRTVLYAELVSDALVEYAYDAELAGLVYGLGTSAHGLQIQISGYNDKIAVLLEKVLVTLRDLEVRADRFAVVKERLQRHFQNWDYQEPFRQIGDYTTWLNMPQGWINEHYLAEIPHVSLPDVQEFFPQLLRQLHIEMLVHGNLYREDALRLTGLVESRLNPQPIPYPQRTIRRSLVIPPGSSYTYSRTLKDAANVNHGIEYFIYVGAMSDSSLRAKLLLVGQLTQEPAFDQLRTQEQLGYVVFSGFRPSATTMGHRVLIQSERNPGYLEERIEAFLRNFAVKLQEMSAEEFEDHKKSLIARRLEKLKNLGEESGRFWRHIDDEYLNFEQAELDVTYIQPLSQADMVQFFNHYISPDSAAQSKLVVHLNAQARADALMDEVSPTVLKEKMLLLLDQFLQSEGITSKPEELSQRLERVDITPDDDAVIPVLEQYLVADLGLNDTKARMILEQGRMLLAALSHKNAVKESSTTVDGKKIVNGDGPAKKPTVLIDDVYQFKATLALTSGPQPVRHPSEFEDLTSKL